ncbi:MAG: class I SAM-dependent methyltransferase [Rhodospirillaceae bacterium]|nr:class I SAM-dependent methyltransferase [Rhodospirillaceae bacterium]
MGFISNRRSILLGSGAALLAGTAALHMPTRRAAAALPAKVVYKSQIAPSLVLRNAIENSPRRPDADKKRDADRKPAETMAFYGIKPGMKVAELMAARGYFTGVLAETVGDTGTVYGQNNKWLRDRFKDGQKPLGDLITKGGYKNIIEQDTELEDLQLPQGQLDAVFIIMFYHDTYWLGINREAMNASVKAALKPGGIYGIIDHSAAPGLGATDVNKNHRIERYVVVDDVLKAGFELAEETDLLENPKDPLNVNVFQQELRGHTNQFVLKFRKPA